MTPLIPLLLAAHALAFAPAATDTYPRQPLDVEHYRFALQLTDSSDRIDGVATVRLRVMPPGLSTVVLDLGSVTPARAGRGMTVRGVMVDGSAARFSHDGDRLTITLGRARSAGDEVELEVKYDGIPAAGLQIKPTPHGDRAFFSDNWPDKARQWLPVIDHIGDKATMEMDVTAPAHYQVISNGARVEETDLPNGARRTIWRESVPIAPWLYVLGVAEFAVQHLDAYRGIPIETWVLAPDRDAGFYDFAVPTRDVLAFYNEWIGPYSYEKLANVQSNSVSGGMEAASAIFYSASSVTGKRDRRWRNVVIHEIAHQWFGNAVTESDWDDVWLSEGFATYFTLLFIEHAYGRDEFVAGLRDSRKTVVDFDAKSPDYRVVHDQLADMSQVTSAMTYQKGSVGAAHAARVDGGRPLLGGDSRLLPRAPRRGARRRPTSARRWSARRGATCAPFFAQWLYRGGIPHLEGSGAGTRRRSASRSTLRQVQSGDPFVLPVEVGIETAGGATRVEVGEMTGRTLQLKFDAPRATVAPGARPQRATAPHGDAGATLR